MSDVGTQAPGVVVFADDWGRHPSSCQHLIRRLRNACPVLWVNSIGTRQVRADSITFRRGLEKLKNWNQGLKQVAEQMWVIDLPMLPGMAHGLVRNINRQLVTWRLKSVLARLGMNRPVILTTLPYIEWLIRGLPRRALVYYCTDDYSHWPSADRETLKEADREISQRANLILAASQALLEQHASSGHCQYFPHGVDFAHFASAQQPDDIPAALAALVQPRIGFFGLIYEKLDFDLLAAVAGRFPQASLVMIGPKAYCPPAFAHLANVHFLGPQPYEELPRYLAGLDVLLLPYLMNDAMIQQSGPLKLRECLASGKPTVSIDVPEVRFLQPHVRIGDSQEAFLHQVQQALEEPAGSPLIKARQQAVEQDGWDRRAEVLRAALERLEPSRRPAAIPSTNGRKTLPRVLDLRTIAGKGGGPEKTLLNSPRFLRDTYEMRLAYIHPTGDKDYDMPARAQQAGADLVSIPETGPADPLTFWKLARVIADFRPDILHAHDYKTNVLAIVLGRWFGLPVMTTMHGYVTRGGRLEVYYRMDRWALRWMDHVVAVSEDLYQELVALKMPPARCSLIENGIDAEQFARRQSAAVAKERAGLNPARLTIGAVGRLSPEKGFDLLIRSADQLLRTGLDLELFIVGEGDQRPQLEALIAELGRADRIRLLGYQSDTRSLYEAMDVFALSSLREGLPNVMLEALAMEVPVVATRIAGVPRVIEHEVNGLLVEPGKAELTQALRRLLSDAALRTRLQQADRRTVETQYSFAVRMEKLRAVYNGLLARKGAAHAPSP